MPFRISCHRYQRLQWSCLAMGRNTGGHRCLDNYPPVSSPPIVMQYLSFCWKLNCYLSGMSKIAERKIQLASWLKFSYSDVFLDYTQFNSNMLHVLPKLTIS